MKRIPENERWNKSEIEGMPWTSWKLKTSGGNKSISMSAPLRVATSTHHAGGAKPVWYNGRLRGMRQQYHWRNGNSHSAECRRRIEKKMKNDPEHLERIQETKRKRREFIEKHAKKFKVDESAEEEQNDEQMDDIGRRGLKRKAEDNLETETMEVMDCMCESPIDVVNIVEEGDMLEEYKADDCMEETTRTWADMTEEEHAEPKIFYDNLTCRV